MKISTKGRYALRLMVDLALAPQDEYISVKSIAERQGISEKYLEQIIKLLSSENFVESVRGKQGGYRLTRSPEEYTVGQILRVTEGSLAPVVCLEGDENTCEHCLDCITVEIWQKILDAVNVVVDSITLQYLADKQKEKENPACC